MFFGKREPEGVAPDGLENLLTNLFEKKIGQFEPKAHGILENMKEARKEFIAACDELETLDAEPYTEDLYFASVSSIKNQKILYTKSIRRIANDMRLETAGGLTSYERYGLTLGGVEDAITEMLKTNASFKTVLYSYSNHFGSFKKAFSGIEKCRDELRREISNKANEAAEYAKIREEISRFNSGREELTTLEQSISALESSLNRRNGAGLEDERGKILKNLEEKRREFSDMTVDATRLSEKISLLTAPLERSARKQDHLSLKKAMLSSFIYDPINKINGEAQYGEFVSLLNEMKENVEKGEIDTKNKEGTLKSISMLLNSDIYSTINSFNSLQERKGVVGEEVKILERTLNELKKGRDSAEKTEKDITLMKEEAEVARKSIISGKSSIERMFSEYYRRQITVIMDS